MLEPPGDFGSNSRMGLLDLLRRLFGRASSITHSCRVCGAGVPDRDLEAGRAVVVARRAYCRACVAERTRGTGGGKANLVGSSSHLGI